MTGLATNETAEYQLTMYTRQGSFEVVYSQLSNTQTFKIPTLSVRQKTLIQYTYQVRVTNKEGVQVLYDGVTYQDAFTLDTYTPPILTNLSAERYSIRPSDTGSSDILSADNAGEYVRFSFTLTPAVTTVSGNSWTLNVKATSGSGKTQNKNGAYTGTTSGITKTDDTTIFPSASFSFDPKEDWTFTFTITDKVTSTSYSTQVAKAESILNVESGGVAVGGFLSTGNAFVNNNLLTGSKNFSGDWQNKETYTEAEPVDGFTVLTKTAAWNGVGRVISLAPGDYTFSCWFKTDDTSVWVYNNVDSQYGDNIGRKVNHATGVWTRDVEHFTIRTTTTCRCRVESQTAGKAISLYGYKLEKGNILNPVWAPAPQDNAEVATFDKKLRFETSDDCGAILRGGLWDGRGYRMDYVNNTQMIDITNTSFAPYSNTRMPMISRVGPIVFFEGGVKCTKTTSTIGTDGIVLCTLPGWARPRVEVSQLSQGYSTNIYWLFVDTDGQVWIKRNQQAGSYTTIPANGQLTFSATWLAADAAPPLPEVT